jgi:hypothetical protein
MVSDKYRLVKPISKGLVLIFSLEYGEQLWHKAVCRKHMRCSVSGRDLYKMEAYRPETNGYNRMDRIDAAIIEKVIEISASEIENNKTKINNNKNPTNMARSKEEIQKVIGMLERYKKVVPPMTAFGDDNHKVIDGDDNHKVIDYQIDVLKGLHDEDDINEMTLFEDEEDEDGTKELSQSEASSVLDALNWLDDGGDEFICEEDIELYEKRKK